MLQKSYTNLLNQSSPKEETTADCGLVLLLLEMGEMICVSRLLVIIASGMVGLRENNIETEREERSGHWEREHLV